MRKLTAEQAERAAARKEQVKAIVKKVGAMSDEQRAELSNKMLVANCEGHTLSPYNNCLIAMQCFNGMTPTIVGGFKQWIKQGRAVRKGEHGMAILFPREVGHNGNGRDDLEGDEPSKPDMRFYSGYVFDISQTMEIETGN